MKHMMIGLFEPYEMKETRFTGYLKLAEAALECNFDVRIFFSGKEMLEQFQPVYQILIIRLPLFDIKLEELLAGIRQKDPFVHIILVSETREFCQIGYNYNVANYLTRPRWYFKLLDELKKYIDNEAHYYKPHLWVEYNRTHHKIYLQKLRYVQGLAHLLRFQYVNDSIVARGPFSVYEEQLTSKGFFRCHNSYLVNLAYIQEVARCNGQYTIHLVTGEKIPVGYGRREQLMEALQKFTNK